jgi:hypothetical protein
LKLLNLFTENGIIGRPVAAAIRLNPFHNLRVGRRLMFNCVETMIKSLNIRRGELQLTSLQKRDQQDLGEYGVCHKFLLLGGS